MRCILTRKEGPRSVATCRILSLQDVECVTCLLLYLQSSSKIQVACLSAQPHKEDLTELAFKPAGLDDTPDDKFVEDLVRDLASLHEAAKAAWITPTDDESAEAAAMGDLVAGQ